MVEAKIRKFAKDCDLSTNMIDRSSYIVKLLETVSSGLPKEKNEKLTRYMCGMISNSNRNSSVRDQIIENFKDWSVEELSRSMKYIGTYFHLLNQAELNEIIHINEKRDILSDKDNPKVDSIPSAVKFMKNNSVSFNRAKEIISNISIHPTFTAHPTETRRPSIIKKQRMLLKIVDTILNGNLSHTKRSLLENEAIRLCRLIMFTGDVRSHDISVRDEINNTLKSTINSLWYSVSELSYDLESSFEQYYKEKVQLYDLLSFHNWVGGDRDGNPNVDSEITKYALKKQVSLVINKYFEDLDQLFDDMSIHKDFAEGNNTLSKSIESDLSKVNVDEKLVTRYIDEPVRLKILCIKEKLIDYKYQLFSKYTSQYSSEEFQKDLAAIEEFLISVSDDDSMVDGILRDIIVRVKVFGLNFMRLDIRQHSDVHERAVHELLKQIRPGISYRKLDEKQKCNIIKDILLTEKSKIKYDSTVITDMLKEVLDTFYVIKEALKVDKKLISSYIVSMTHEKSDILEVLFLGKVAGIVNIKNSSMISGLSIVPLYETINDLNNASSLLKELIEDDLYKLHLKNKGDFQEIMLGYSDSNKDGGFGMANYCLNKCQLEVSDIMNEYNIDFRLFHGRGGSISRGGGKSNKAILSLPDKCQNGKIRFTEQGEVINYRYGSSRIAKRHLEQIVSAQITALTNKNKVKNNKYELIKTVLDQSYKKYRNEIINERCWHFLLNATPINHISKIPITSRPASRKKMDEHVLGFDDLRAIPWVFSWTQVRYNLSGWYGMGSVLKNAVNDPSNLEELKKIYSSSKFFKQLLDNMSFEMARSRLKTSSNYAKSDEDLSFHLTIEKEFERTLYAYKKITGYNSLLERNKVIDSSINFRNPFTDILNFAQAELLNRYRQSNKKDSKLDNAIFVSINHIAAAMQTTG